jgi:hypothetical protein
MHAHPWGPPTAQRGAWLIQIGDEHDMRLRVSQGGDSERYDEKIQQTAREVWGAGGRGGVRMCTQVQVCFATSACAAKSCGHHVKLKNLAHHFALWVDIVAITRYRYGWLFHLNLFPYRSLRAFRQSQV